MLWCLYYIQVIFLGKKLKSQFWWYSKVPQANCLWANFGSFGQFWVDLATMAMVDIMPSFERKKKKLHNL